MRFPVSLLFALVPVVATGSTIIGNPASKVQLVDGNNVYVHSVKAYRCTSGHHTMSVDETLDQWDSSTIQFDEDDFCDVVVRVRWVPGGAIEPVAVSGFDTLEITSTGSSFVIELDAALEKARIP